MKFNIGDIVTYNDIYHDGVIKGYSHHGYRCYEVRWKGSTHSNFDPIDWAEDNYKLVKRVKKDIKEYPISKFCKGTLKEEIK